MPIEVIPGLAAIDTVKNNDVSSWPARGVENSRVDPIATPSFYPTFHVNQGEPIFTIGSCFARNVEQALMDRGFELPARDALKDDPEFSTIGPNILNNYGVPSIYNEISWALGTKEFIPEQNFYETSPGKFVDIHLNQAIRPASYDVVNKRRAAIRAAYAAIKRCRVVIITLGLTECWYDSLTKLYLNTPPRRSIVRSEPDRFEMHVLDFQETVDFLYRTFDALKEHGHPELHVLLTVSPVPLTATHRKQDVMVANMYSKSVLRAAAEHVVAKYDFVDYYPSFESVLISQRDEVWEDDHVHIKKPIIVTNVTRMIHGYIGKAGLGNEDEDSLLNRLSGADVKPGEIYGELERRPDAIETSPGLALLFAEAAVKLRRRDDARRALDNVPEDFEPIRRNWVLMQLLFDEDNFVDLLPLCIANQDQYKRRPAYWRMYVSALGDTGQYDDLKKIVREWAKVYPHAAEPYRHGATTLAKDPAQARDAEFMFRKAREMARGDDDEGRIDLDYAEYLAEAGRLGLARNALKTFQPKNPMQSARFQELKIRLNIK